MLVTLHTLLNAIICCFQLNTEWGANANRKVDYLGMDVVGLTVYVLWCNAFGVRRAPGEEPLGPHAIGGR